MMGSKDRAFAPLVNVSLEKLVPADHFYRHLHKSLSPSTSPLYVILLLHFMQLVDVPR